MRSDLIGNECTLRPLENVVKNSRWVVYLCVYLCAHVSVCALEGVRYKMFCPNKILHITKNMTQSNILLSLCVCVYACLRLCGVSRYLVLCVCVCVCVCVG